MSSEWTANLRFKGMEIKAIHNQLDFYSFPAVDAFSWLAIALANNDNDDVENNPFSALFTVVSYQG